MALETVEYQQDLFGHESIKDLYTLFGGNWSYDLSAVQKEENRCLDNFDEQIENYEYASWNLQPHSMVPHLEEWGPNSSEAVISEEFPPLDASTSLPPKPKRRRSRSKKNMEEIENQRMTHIAVERNRRKQMNEYLSELRGLMPDFYVQKGDQASIIGGAINYVKELEQQLQVLDAQKQMNQDVEVNAGSSFPFAEFFTFPQYSVSATQGQNSNGGLPAPGFADIEVTMADSHANLKIRSERRPKQLLKMVSGLQSLRLIVLHLNVTTVDQFVLYSVSTKVEDGCRLTSVDEIAFEVNQLLGRIQDETIMS